MESYTVSPAGFVHFTYRAADGRVFIAVARTLETCRHRCTAWMLAPKETR